MNMFVYIYPSFFFAPSNGFSKQLLFPNGSFIARCSFHFSHRTNVLVQSYSFQPECLFVRCSLYTFIFDFYLRHLRLRLFLNFTGVTHDYVRIYMYPFFSHRAMASVNGFSFQSDCLLLGVRFIFHTEQML